MDTRKTTRTAWDNLIGILAFLALVGAAVISNRCCPKDAPTTLQSWFAWFPVRVNNRLRWFTPVLRRASYYPGEIAYRYWVYTEVNPWT